MYRFEDAHRCMQKECRSINIDDETRGTRGRALAEKCGQDRDWSLLVRYAFCWPDLDAGFGGKGGESRNPIAEFDVERRRSRSLALARRGEVERGRKS